MSSQKGGRRTAAKTRFPGEQAILLDAEGHMERGTDERDETGRTPHLCNRTSMAGPLRG